MGWGKIASQQNQVIDNSNERHILVALKELPEYKAFEKMVENTIERCKEELVGASLEKVQFLQGEVAGLRAILFEVNNAQNRINEAEEVKKMLQDD